MFKKKEKPKVDGTLIHAIQHRNMDHFTNETICKMFVDFRTIHREKIEELENKIKLLEFRVSNTKGYKIKINKSHNIFLGRQYDPSLIFSCIINDKINNTVVNLSDIFNSYNQRVSYKHQIIKNKHIIDFKCDEEYKRIMILEDKYVEIPIQDKLSDKGFINIFTNREKRIADRLIDEELEGYKKKDNN